MNEFYLNNHPFLPVWIKHIWSNERKGPFDERGKALPHNNQSAAFYPDNQTTVAPSNLHKKQWVYEQLSIKL